MDPPFLRYVDDDVGEDGFRGVRPVVVVVVAVVVLLLLLL